MRRGISARHHLRDGNIEPGRRFVVGVKHFAADGGGWNKSDRQRDCRIEAGLDGLDGDVVASGVGDPERISSEFGIKALQFERAVQIGEGVGGDACAANRRRAIACNFTDASTAGVPSARITLPRRVGGGLMGAGESRAISTPVRSVPSLTSTSALPSTSEPAKRCETLS
jgi:hypothetical protein